MVTPSTARQVVGRHVLLDGYDLVVDLERSRSSWLVDARTGRRYLDLFTFYGSLPLGMNHPALTDDPDFRAELAAVALHKPSNSDFVTTAYAAFVDTFERVLGDPDLPHLFLIDGGALAVENALKAAFDWKSRHNEAAGRDPALGTSVLHLRSAFHGRTGYTLSLTNTEPVKTARFPAFDWPRVDAPAMTFPLDEHEAALAAAEVAALEQAEQAFAAHPHDVACTIVEPIQGEGGDNHLRGEFLRALQTLTHAHDALFVVDEVQTGCGLTGSSWAYQQLGLTPDLVAFGKKVQVCGVMAGRRLDEVDDHVFAVPGRLNSTWGGNLTDMVRARRVLEVIDDEGLVARAASLGKRLLDQLRDLQARHASLVGNARGRGLMCAFDLPDGESRAALLRTLFDEQHVLMPGCGPRTVRMRPSLAVTEGELDAAVAALDTALRLHAEHR